MSGNDSSETSENPPDETVTPTDDRTSESPTRDVDDGDAGDGDGDNAAADVGDAEAVAGADASAVDERGATNDGRDAAADERVPADASASDLTIEPRSLHQRVRIVWVVQSLVSAAILAAIVGAIGTFVLDAGVWVGPATFLVVGTLVVVHAILRYRSWSYEVREDALYLERGVLTRVRTVVPYVRIQHVDASRGPLERAVGLASSVVYTAGTRGADVTIPGLTPDRADDLQERLKRLAILADGDDAV